MWPPFPNATAYNGTNACGAENENRVSMSGYASLVLRSFDLSF